MVGLGRALPPDTRYVQTSQPDPKVRLTGPPLWHGAKNPLPVAAANLSSGNKRAGVVDLNDLGLQLAPRAFNR